MGGKDAKRRSRSSFDLRIFSNFSGSFKSGFRMSYPRLALSVIRDNKEQAPPRLLLGNGALRWGRAKSSSISWATLVGARGFTRLHLFGLRQL